jgi:hypothetical protein
MHMVTAEARIETERPSRYLVQLCRHISNISNMSGKTRHLRHGPRMHLAGQAQPPPVGPHAEWSETHGTISFGGGKLTMQASAGALTLRAETDGEEDLKQLQDLVTERLEKFGRRDHLKVNWQRPQSPAVRPGQAG